MEDQHSVQDAGQQAGNSDAATIAEAKLRSERKKHRAAVKKYQNEIIALQSQLKSVSESLREANRKVLVMQPSSPISDQAIADAYKDLCQLIEDWVDRNCATLKCSGRKIEDKWLPESEGQILADLLDDNEALLGIAQKYPNSGDIILTGIIMRFLFEKLLRSSRWLPGMSPEQEKILRIAMDNICVAFPARDSITPEHWRCNTYTSLIQSPRLCGAATDQISRLQNQLCMIATALTGTKDHLSQKGLVTIVSAAADLAHMMRQCPVSYSFVYSFTPLMPLESRDLKAKTFDDVDVIDVEEGCMALRATMAGLGDAVVGGAIISTIIPGLVKISPPDGVVVRLVKGTAIAEVSAMPGRGSKQSVPANADANKVALAKSADMRQWGATDILLPTTPLVVHPAMTWAAIAGK